MSACPRLRYLLHLAFTRIWLQCYALEDMERPCFSIASLQMLDASFGGGDGRSRAFPASVVRSPPFRPRFVPLVRVTPGALFPLVRRSYILYHPCLRPASAREPPQFPSAVCYGSISCS